MKKTMILSLLAAALTTANTGCTTDDALDSYTKTTTPEKKRKK